MKIAKFSNGHIDAYKGKRAVTAGWMIVHPSGRIESGHSLDRATAEKTARSNCTIERTISPREAGHAYFIKKVMREGYRNVAAYNADVKARNEAYRSTCQIEIVDLD